MTNKKCGGESEHQYHSYKYEVDKIYQIKCIPGTLLWVGRVYFLRPCKLNAPQKSYISCFTIYCNCTGEGTNTLLPMGGNMLLL